MSGVFLFLETSVHHLWEVAGGGDDTALYFYFHWVWAPALFGGAIIYVVKRHFPECQGGGMDTAKICMALL